MAQIGLNRLPSEWLVAQIGLNRQPTIGVGVSLEIYVISDIKKKYLLTISVFILEMIITYIIFEK